MKNDIHIAMMKRAIALIKSANKTLDELYVKHNHAKNENKKVA